MKKRIAMSAAAFVGVVAMVGPMSHAGIIGPDVICGDVNGIVRWAGDGTQTSYSVGTTSCNIGDVILLWQQTTPNHPVISQKVYRLDDGKFELIGLGWLKHSFCALQQFLCNPACAGGGGCQSQLHPGCSDPYTPMRNGTQSTLGPRWQINAVTGVFPYPFDPGDGPPFDGFDRRIILQNVDIDPALNPGATYFMEAGYTTHDDADAGNGNNNMSYRRVTFGPGPTFSPSPSGPTTQMKTAVEAWADFDSDVEVTTFDIPDDGRMQLGYEVTDNGDGTWHYEYALYNFNSDRAAREFSLPIGDGVTISNNGFHDISFHSGDGIGGENQDGTDWSFLEGGAQVAWNTVTLPQDPNGNALRWGTMYTFRFDADTPPTDVEATVGLFKFGSPQTMSVATVGPSDGDTTCVADLDGSGDVGFGDLLILLNAWGDSGVDADLDGGGVGFSDLLIVLNAWGPC